MPNGSTRATWPLLLLLVLLPAHAAQAAGPAPQLEASIRSQTLEQAGRRAGELIRDEALAKIARRHSRAMHDADTLAHELNGLGPAERFAREHRSLFGLVSENVAMQKHWPPDMDLAKQLVQGWMNSPGHRANILADYAIFEVGCHGDRQVMYCTQLFVRSPARIADELPFLQPADQDLDVSLADPAGAAGRRISLSPPQTPTSGAGVAVSGATATLPLPVEPGLLQLRLWTPQPGDASRYRVIPGPFVCAVANPARSGPRPDHCAL